MDKRTVSAIFLILVVIIAYQLVILPKVAPPPPTGETPSVPDQVLLPQTQADPEPQHLPAPPLPAGESAQQAEPPQVPAVGRREVSVDRPLFRAVVDNLRGGIRSWQLLDYEYGKDAKENAGEPVDLLPPAGGPGALGITFTDSLSEASFSAPLAVEEGGDVLRLLGVDQYGLVMTRSYRFSPENYTVDLEITFENRSQSPRNVSWEMFVGPDLVRHRQSGRGPDSPEAVVMSAGELDKVKVKNPGEVRSLGTVSWVGIRDRYFLLALVALEGKLTGFARKNPESAFEVGYRSEPVTIVPRQIVSYHLTCFMGPKEQERLVGPDLGLERSINYGWFSWLAQPFLSILKFFYRYLQNWGLAILALTLVVKIALFPISQGMYRSMRKMQALQPQIQALKKKFKDDSQALQRETMALYKQYKVNPMAGCFPMVIQIPVFFALYRVLYNAIELRGASFMYIPDLSQKDPYYITPLLMGATMILQQRMSPTSGDPKQARMMMFMPIIFTAMFLNFSSGLVLYFLFSNVFAIGEQTIIRKWSAQTVAEPVAVVREVPSRKGSKKKKR